MRRQYPTAERSALPAIQATSADSADFAANPHGRPSPRRTACSPSYTPRRAIRAQNNTNPPARYRQVCLGRPPRPANGSSPHPALPALLESAPEGLPSPPDEQPWKTIAIRGEPQQGSRLLLFRRRRILHLLSLTRAAQQTPACAYSATSGAFPPIPVPAPPARESHPISKIARPP